MARGRTKTDCLDSRHTFSFGEYQDPSGWGSDRNRIDILFLKFLKNPRKVSTATLIARIEQRRAGHSQRAVGDAGEALGHPEGSVPTG
jgi:hypothetical protein